MAPLAAVLPDGGLGEVDHGSAIALLTLAVPLVGIALGVWLWGRPGRADPAAGTAPLLRFWRSGWGFDAVYRELLERPFAAVARMLAPERLDAPFDALVMFVRWAHRRVVRTQTGYLRSYAFGMGLGTVFLLTAALVLS